MLHAKVRYQRFSFQAGFEMVIENMTFDGNVDEFLRIIAARVGAYNIQEIKIKGFPTCWDRNDILCRLGLPLFKETNNALS